MGKVVDLYPNREKIFGNQLITLDDLETFKVDLLHSIKDILTAHKNQNVKKWLKSHEVKKVLSISTGTLQNLRGNGTLPYSKIGGLIYYDADEINRIFEERKHISPFKKSAQLQEFKAAPK